MNASEGNRPVRPLRGARERIKEQLVEMWVAEPKILGPLTVVFAAILIFLWLVLFTDSDDRVREVAGPVGALVILLVLVPFALVAAVLGARPRVKLWITFLLLADATALIVLAFAVLYRVTSFVRPEDFGGVVLHAADATYFALGSLWGGTGNLSATGGTGRMFVTFQSLTDVILAGIVIAVVAARLAEALTKEQPDTTDVAPPSNEGAADSGDGGHDDPSDDAKGEDAPDPAEQPDHRPAAKDAAEERGEERGVETAPPAEAPGPAPAPVRSDPAAAPPSRETAPTDSAAAAAPADQH